MNYTSLTMSPCYPLLNSEEIENKGKVLLAFLKRTKEGEYAGIDKRSLSYARVKEQREPYYNEGEFYCSLR